MDWILTGTMFLSTSVCLLCIALHKRGESGENEEYDFYLNEDKDHIHYEKTLIRYRRGRWKKYCIRD